MLQYIKEKYVKNSKKCYFYSIFTAFYSINSKFYQEIFENLVWSDKLSIPDAHPIGCFHLLFVFDSLKPPTMRDYQNTWVEAAIRNVSTPKDMGLQKYL